MRTMGLRRFRVRARKSPKRSACMSILPSALARREWGRASPESLDRPIRLGKSANSFVILKPISGNKQ